MSECRRAVAIAMIAVAMALLPWRAALAGEPTTTVSTAQMAAKSGYQRQLVCNKTRSPGSLVPKKTCTTRAQIDAERKAGQRLLHNPRRTGSGAGGTIAIGAWPGVAALAEGVENPPASSQ